MLNDTSAPQSNLAINNQHTTNNSPVTRKNKHASSLDWLREGYNTARGETAMWVAVNNPSNAGRTQSLPKIGVAF